MLARLHHRSSNLRHVVLEGLSVDQATRLIHDCHDHLLCKDVHQLYAIAILATHQLLLTLVVICGREQFPEDHLGNPRLVLRVLCHINRLTVVLDTECLGRTRDLNGLNQVCRLATAKTHNLIVSVHQELVNQFVETRIHGDGCCLEALASPRGVVRSRPEEHLLGGGRHTTNVRVGKVQDVLAVRLALIGCRKVGHFTRG